MSGVSFPVLTVHGPPDPYRYEMGHKALTKMLFSMPGGIFDLMGQREVEGVTWEKLEELLVMNAHLRSNRAPDPAYRFSPAYPLAIEGWEAYWLQLPPPAGTTEALGLIAARRPDLPMVPRVFVVEPSQGKPILAEWRYDSRIRYRDFEPTEEALVAFVSKVLSDSRHPPPRTGAPIMRAPPAPDPPWWANQPAPEGVPDVDASAPSRAAARMAEGVMLYRQGKYLAAIDKLEESHALHANSTVAQMIVVAHHKLGNVEEAREAAATYGVAAEFASPKPPPGDPKSVWTAVGLIVLAGVLGLGCAPSAGGLVCGLLAIGIGIAGTIRLIRALSQ
ncbi:MAG: hypothetical protein AAF211_03540 [Myxococcota bacterium]